MQRLRKTHPDLSVVVSRREASAVPGESAASDAVKVAAQGVDALPGFTVPQLGAERNAPRRLRKQKSIHLLCMNYEKYDRNVQIRTRLLQKSALTGYI